MGRWCGSTLFWSLLLALQVEMLLFLKDSNNLCFIALHACTHSFNQQKLPPCWALKYTIIITLYSLSSASRSDWDTSVVGSQSQPSSTRISHLGCDQVGQAGYLEELPPADEESLGWWAEYHSTPLHSISSS